jgi:hypothetical protein
MSKESYFGIACGIGAVAVTIIDNITPQLAPIVGWPIAIALFALCGILLIKGIRKKESHELLVLTPHTSAIGLSGMTGYPDKPLNALWLCLGVSVNPISNKPIDTLDLLIDSETIHANQWSGKNVAAFHVDFDVTGWQMKGEKQVELIAKIGNNTASSGRFPIDFSREPSGRSHRI